MATEELSTNALIEMTSDAAAQRVPVTSIFFWCKSLSNENKEFDEAIIAARSRCLQLRVRQIIGNTNLYSTSLSREAGILQIDQEMKTKLQFRLLSLVNLQIFYDIFTNKCR